MLGMLSISKGGLHLTHYLQRDFCRPEKELASLLQLADCPQGSIGLLGDGSDLCTCVHFERKELSINCYVNCS